MAEKPAALTAYVILRRDPGPDSYANPWREDGPRQQARSAKQAIRQALELRELRTQTDTDVSGTYAAVPARSWQPITAKVHTQTVLNLE